MSFRADHAGSRSDTGCVREHNEDSVIVKPPLYAVADGMGGHAAGGVASEIAVDILAENALSITSAQDLIDTVRNINRSIIDAARSGTGRPGMGTTLTAAVLDGTRILLAQVGDSRAYLLHKHSLQQLTRDHSYVGELLAGGHISKSEAASHPKRSVITRALGSDLKTEADIYELEAVAGDRLLLCSDGLYGMVSDEDIANILIAELDPQAACDRLIASAREGGGHDNISAIVVDISEAKSKFLAFCPEEEALHSRSFSKERSPHKKRPRKLHVGILAFVILLVLLIGGAVGGTYWYASESAFLRTSDDGMVAVYRGLPGEVLPGLRLEWHEYTSTVKASDLLASTSERLQSGIRVDSLKDAASLLASYEKQISDQETRQGQRTGQNQRQSTSQTQNQGDLS